MATAIYSYILHMKFSLGGGGGREGVVILGDSFSSWGREKGIFWLVGGHMSDMQYMSDLTKICSKTTFMKKSCHKEVIENIFHVSKCSKSLF